MACCNDSLLASLVMELSFQVSHLKQKNAELLDEVRTKDQEITDLSNALSDSQTENQRLQENMDELRQNVEVLKEEKAELVEQLTTKTEEIEKLSSAISESEDKNQLLQDAFNESRQKIRDLEIENEDFSQEANVTLMFRPKSENSPWKYWNYAAV